MFNSKQNRIILIVSATIILALVAFAILRDTSQVASLNKVTKLVKAKKIKHILQSEETYYIKTEDSLYSIPVSQVSPRLLENYSIEVDNDSSLLMTIVFVLMALGTLSYGVRYWMKRESGESESGLPFASAASPSSSEGEGITPVESDVTFDVSQLLFSLSCPDMIM